MENLRYYEEMEDEAPSRRDIFIQTALEYISGRNYTEQKHLVLDVNRKLTSLGYKAYSISQSYKLLTSADIQPINENGTTEKILKYTGSTRLNNIISYQSYYRRIYFTVDSAYGKLITKIINQKYPKEFLNAVSIDNMVICFYKPEKVQKKSGDSYKPSRSQLKEEILEILTKELNF